MQGHATQLLHAGSQDIATHDSLSTALPNTFLSRSVELAEWQEEGS